MTSYSPAGKVEFDGREIVLFRRSARPDSPLCFRKQIQGRRRWVTTDTADLTEAQARALGLLRKIKAGVWEERMLSRRPKGIPTVAQVIDAFSNGDVHVRPATARQYARCLRLIVRQATGRPALNQPIDRLTGELVREWQAKRQGSDRVNFVDPAESNTSINSILRQARGIFSKRAVESYQADGWTVPDCIEGFRRARNVREVSHTYVPIPAPVIEKMNAAMPALRESDERLWVMLLMIRLMGLRRSEIIRARTGWIVERPAGPVLAIQARDGEKAPKRQDGDVPIPDELAEWFASNSNGHLIPGSDAERRRLAEKLSAWVRPFLPDRVKSLHELRKHAGSVVVQKTGSWERGAQFLRIDLEIAKSYYLAFVEPAEPLSITDL